MKLVNERIKSRRTSLGLTLLEISEYLGVKEATVQRYESGEIKNIKHDTIQRLSEILKCSPSYLMGWEDEETNELPASTQEIIRKFESLDDMGQHTVNTVLNMEYDRCTKSRTNVAAAQIPGERQYTPNDEIITMAAHQVGHEGPLTPDQMDQIKRAMQNALAKRDQ